MRGMKITWRLFFRGEEYFSQGQHAERLSASFRVIFDFAANSKKPFGPRSYEGATLWVFASERRLLLKMYCHACWPDLPYLRFDLRSLQEYHSLPDGISIEEVIAWEESIKHPPPPDGVDWWQSKERAEVGPYSDWCEEHGWTQRAEELRAGK